MIIAVGLYFISLIVYLLVDFRASIIVLQYAYFEVVVAVAYHLYVVADRMLVFQKTPIRAEVY